MYLACSTVKTKRRYYETEKEHLKQFLCVLLCSLSYMMCLLATVEKLTWTWRGLLQPMLQLSHQKHTQQLPSPTISLCRILFLHDSILFFSWYDRQAHSTLKSSLIYMAANWWNYYYNKGTESYAMLLCSIIKEAVIKQHLTPYYRIIVLYFHSKLHFSVKYNSE